MVFVFLLGEGPCRKSLDRFRSVPLHLQSKGPRNLDSLPHKLVPVFFQNEPLLGLHKLLDLRPSIPSILQERA